MITDQARNDGEAQNVAYRKRIYCKAEKTLCPKYALRIALTMLQVPCPAPRMESMQWSTCPVHTSSRKPLASGASVGGVLSIGGMISTAFDGLASTSMTSRQAVRERLLNRSAKVVVALVASVFPRFIIKMSALSDNR